MEIKILKKGHYTLRLQIDGVSHTYVNALRRICMAEVPTLAIDTVMVEENNTLMYDEIISHRLGLIPLKTDLDILVPRSRCSCEYGCPNCTVIYKTEKKGPGTLYSNELVPDHPELTPVYDNIPITKLTEDQSLKFEAYAVLGISKHHSKWQPALSMYKNMPKIEITKDCDNCKICIDACPKKLFKEHDNKVIVENIELCTMCKSCTEACPKNAIKLSSIPDSFIFTVESFGSLSPDRIIQKAIEVLSEKIDSFKEEFEKASP